MWNGVPSKEQGRENTCTDILKSWHFSFCLCNWSVFFLDVPAKFPLSTLLYRLFSPLWNENVASVWTSCALVLIWMTTRCKHQKASGPCNLNHVGTRAGCTVQPSSTHLHVLRGIFTSLLELWVIEIWG